MIGIKLLMFRTSFSLKNNEKKILKSDMFLLISLIMTDLAMNFQIGKYATGQRY